MGDDDEGGGCVAQDGSGGDCKEIQLDVEEETEEANNPILLKDPGKPSAREIEQHNITHMPFRSWCPSCVAGKATNRAHRRQDEESRDKQVPEIVFDYGFLSGEGDQENTAVQVAKDTRTKAIFAHVVPRKGLAHAHGAEELIKDIEKLGYKKIILKSDGEPALKNIQEEVRRRREDPTIIENSPVGESQSNGIAERCVRAVFDQVRVLRHALEIRLGLKLNSMHPVLCWLVEHAADLLTKYQVSSDGKTAYERWKGKKYNREMIEFGEKVHYKENVKKDKNHKLEARWGEGFFLGFQWRTGEAAIGTPEGVVRASALRRVGGHRRWDGEGLGQVTGLPWKWKPDGDEGRANLRVRWLEDGERLGEAVAQDGSEKRVNRLKLRKCDFIKHGFTQNCLGCKAILAGAEQRGHSEACRARMTEALSGTPEGRLKIEQQEEKENQWIARRIMEDAERRKRRKTGTAQEAPDGSSCSPGSSSTSSPGPTISPSYSSAAVPIPEGQCELPPQDLALDSPMGGECEVDASNQGGDAKRMKTSDADMSTDVAAMEHFMQEDFAWEVSQVSDMCMAVDPELQRQVVSMTYYDENTWEPLDPREVDQGEQEEMNRFKKMGVYTYENRQVAANDPEGKFVKVKWVRTKKGGGVRCRLVAQELGFGERMDELFAGTPSLGVSRLAMALACRRSHVPRKVMIMDVKCAFLYGHIKRKVYIELPPQDPKFGDGNLVGRLIKSMYGTRDAPQIWQEVVNETMTALGFEASKLQPSLYFHRDRKMIVVVHVDDFLCIGGESDLEWLYQKVSENFEVSRKIIGEGHDAEGSYLNRIIRWSGHGYEMEGDPKHAAKLSREWGMDQCAGVDTPLTKDMEVKISEGAEIQANDVTKVRRAIALVNYMAQDRPDLVPVSRVLSQQMASPKTNVIIAIKRVIRYLRKFPRCVLTMTHDGNQEIVLDGWTDSDWAGDVVSRKSCSGGLIKINGITVAFWGKTQMNVALSSGEAELNSAVKGVSELIGFCELVQEIVGDPCKVSLRTDASACKGMLLRKGCGRVKHLSTKQLWCQGAVSAYGITVIKIPRVENSSDLLTHCLSSPAIDSHLNRMGFWRG